LSKFTAIFFDAGFTLLNLSAGLPERCAEVAAEFGLSPDQAAMQAALPLTRAYLLDNSRLPNDIFASEAKVRHFWDGFYGLVLRHGGVAEHHLPSLLDRLYVHNNSSAGWHLYPEVLPTLIALRQRGIGVGVVSDWGVDLLEHILVPLGVADHCDFVISSAVVGLSKPSADLFHLALWRVGLRADQVAYVGDNYVLDVLGARSAGIEGVLIDRHHQMSGRPSDCRVIHSLTELLPLVV